MASNDTPSNTNVTSWRAVFAHDPAFRQRLDRPPVGTRERPLR